MLPHSTHFKLYDIIEEGQGIKTKETNMKWTGLPFLSGYISDKGILYTGGFDKKVAVFNRSAGNNIFNFRRF